jgi:glutaminyl-tRNA synthetase
MPFSRELWIEGEDFMEVPSKGYRRLFPGNKARLRYGYVVECTGCDKDESGRVVAVHCNYLPETRSGTPGADSVKVKGNLHWVSAAHACAAEIRLYDRLFNVPAPGARREGDALELERDFLDDLNPESKQTIVAQVEPMPARRAAGRSFPVRAPRLLRR